MRSPICDPVHSSALAWVLLSSAQTMAERQELLETIPRRAGVRPKLVGVDGCRGGWIAVSEIDGSLDARVHADWRSLMRRAADDSTIAVDIPIGLPIRGARPFAKRSAIPLTRATLMLAWQAVRIDRPTACITLGIAKSVAEMIGTLRLADLDRISDRHHRHLKPRWAERPGVWRTLLSAANAASPPSARRTDAYGLQLLTGDLVPISKPPPPLHLRRAHPVPAHRET